MINVEVKDAEGAVKIIEDKKPNIEALEAEKALLLKRLAEIDAILKGVGDLWS